MREIIDIINIVIFSYLMISCMVYMLLVITSFPDILRRFEESKYGDMKKLMNNNFTIPITILMPAYNIAHEIIDAVSSVLDSNYDGVNLIVINDGSTDNTLQKLISTYSMFPAPIAIENKLKTAKVRGYYQSKRYPQIVVLDKEHSNGGDSLNAGLNACRTPIYLTVDADTLLEKDALLRIMFSFISKPNCIAVGGALYISNDNVIKNGKIESPRIPKHFVPAMQICEYFRAFLFGRAGWSSFGGALCYAGAFTLFERKAVMDAGGYDAGNFAYDAELVLRLHSYMQRHHFPYSMDFTAAAFAWTEVPQTFKHFWGQRDRWQRGSVHSFWKHRYMMFNPKYGIIGMFTYPFYVFFEIFSPIVEIFCYLFVAFEWYLGLVSTEMLLLFGGIALGCAGAFTVSAILMNVLTFNKFSGWKDMLHILMLSIPEMLFFRQYNLLCKVYATGKYVVNRANGKQL